MAENQAERFGIWLNLTMENRGIRGRDLAKKLKVTDSAVSSWRSGAGAPSLENCLKLAKILDVHPIRLAVLAGHMDAELVGEEPLPMPEPTARRNRVKSDLAKIPGLTGRERQHLINEYDRKVQGE